MLQSSRSGSVLTPLGTRWYHGSLHPPPNDAQPDALDRFFVMEFGDYDDLPPPSQQATFDGNVDTVASSQRKEEASVTGAYKIERNVD